MTKSVATCREADTVEDLMEVMTHGRFRHVPVLDDERALCGLISIGDVVKTRIAETLNEANSLREYISRGLISGLGTGGTRVAGTRGHAQAFSIASASMEQAL